MVPALIVLLCSQLAGELVARLLQLPVPGPVLGLLFLFAVLLARGRTAETVGGTARVLLGNLALLFVPAGVGLVRHGARLRMEWLAIFAALAVSTAVTIAVTALVFQAVARALGPRS